MRIIRICVIFHFRQNALILLPMLICDIIKESEWLLSCEIISWKKGWRCYHSSRKWLGKTNVTASNIHKGKIIDMAEMIMINRTSVTERGLLLKIHFALVLVRLRIFVFEAYNISIPLFSFPCRVGCAASLSSPTFIILEFGCNICPCLFPCPWLLYFTKRCRHLMLLSIQLPKRQNFVVSRWWPALRASSCVGSFLHRFPSYYNQAPDEIQ